MKISVLASGSKGNATIIQTENHKILFDLGMNLKYIKEKLKSKNIDPKDIDYIFLTHTHTDHISALSSFIKKYHPIICMSYRMFMEISDLEKYEHVIILDDEIVIDDLHIEVIATSHDAEDSRGFIITNKNKSLVYITDTGYINQRYFSKLKNKDYYLIESNHDIEMLLNGPYPKWLKMRVNSDYGHLSNKAASIYLSKLIGKDTKEIILMHLSEVNNTEEIALATIKETFMDHNIEFDNIKCAKQKEIVEVGE